MRPLPLPSSVETDRLVLTPWAPGDATALRAALAESVEHLLPWIPWASRDAPALATAEALVQRWIGEREAGTNFIYAARQREDGDLVGGIGLYARVGPGRLEMGYWIRRGAAGQGYATEAARALTRVALGMEGVSALEMHIDPTNLASARIPEKLGYRLVEVRGGSRVQHEGGSGRTAVYERTEAA